MNVRDADMKPRVTSATWDVSHQGHCDIVIRPSQEYLSINAKFEVLVGRIK